jgi:molybdopterin converting factor small subunit
MPVLRIPTPMRTYVNGLAEVQVSGMTAGAAFEDLLAQYPALRPHLTNTRGELRSFVNLFLGKDNIKDLPLGWNTPLAETDKLLLIPSAAGG